MIGRLNWMADRSQKGLTQSGGIMVNYIYRYYCYPEQSFSFSSVDCDIEIHPAF